MFGNAWSTSFQDEHVVPMDFRRWRGRGLRDRPLRLLGIIIMFPTYPNAAKHCRAKWGWKTRYDLSYLHIPAHLCHPELKVNYSVLSHRPSVVFQWEFVFSCIFRMLSTQADVFLTSIFLPWGVCFRHYAKLEAGERAIPPQGGGGTGASPAVGSGRGVANHWGNIQFAYLGTEKNNAY